MKVGLIKCVLDVSESSYSFIFRSSDPLGSDQTIRQGAWWPPTGICGCPSNFKENSLPCPTISLRSFCDFCHYLLNVRTGC